MVHTATDKAILHAIMDAAVDAMIVSDQGGNILRINAAAGRVFQYDVAEMVGQSVNMLMPKALAMLHDGFMSHHIETGKKRIIDIGRDVEGLRRDGPFFRCTCPWGTAQSKATASLSVFCMTWPGAKPRKMPCRGPSVWMPSAR